MKKLGCFVGVIGLILGATVAQASLSVHYQFAGTGNWSIDGVGSNNDKGPIGNLRAIVPPGSTVEKAFLYCTRTTAASTIKPTIVFDDETYGPSDFTALGLSSADLQAFRADVTAQVSETINGGSTNMFLFSVDSEDLNEDTDGEALVIVYSNGDEVERTIAILDGFSQPAGDNTTFHFASPLVIGPTFEALMSLGIGFSFQEDGVQQYSIVNIDGKRLTTSAGGEDDGISENGGLITIGGIGDDPSNPADPFATPTNPRSDDELYNLAPTDSDQIQSKHAKKPKKQGGILPFEGLTPGQTSFTVNTLNPSGDDNIFFLGLNVTARGSVSGGSGSCSSSSDLVSSLTELSLSKSQTLRLQRQVTIIGKAIDRRNAYAARQDCLVLGKLVASLVRLGALSPSSASDIESCCSSLISLIPSSGGNSGGNNNNND